MLLSRPKVISQQHLDLFNYLYASTPNSDKIPEGGHENLVDNEPTSCQRELGCGPVQEFVLHLIEKELINVSSGYR
jgi:hypothetical protein